MDRGGLERSGEKVGGTDKGTEKDRKEEERRGGEWASKRGEVRDRGYYECRKRKRKLYVTWDRGEGDRGGGREGRQTGRG